MYEAVCRFVFVLEPGWLQQPKNNQKSKYFRSRKSHRRLYQLIPAHPLPPLPGAIAQTVHRALPLEVAGALVSPMADPQSSAEGGAM